MLYCDRLEVSEGIDVDKTNALKKCGICHHWYFLDKRFKFCNGCHDFYDKDIPKANSNYNCLAVILVDFVLKKDEIYCPKVFLEQWKYIEKKDDWIYDWWFWKF